MDLLKNNVIVNLLRYSWKYSSNRIIFLTFVIFSLIANAIGLMSPIVIGRIFDSIQFSANDPELFLFIIKSFCLIIVIEIGFWIFHGSSRIMEQKHAFLTRKGFKNEMFDKVMDLPAQWHKDHHSGDTIDKINKASENFYYFVSGIFLLRRDL